MWKSESFLVYSTRSLFCARFRKAVLGLCIKPARAAVTKYHRLSGLTVYFLTVLESGSLRARRWQGWFPAASLLGLQVIFSLYIQSSLHVCKCLVSVCIQISSYKDTSYNGLGLTITTSFKLNNLLKDLIANTVTF